MCGILLKIKDDGLHKFLTSLNLMSHRGPDNTRVVVFPKLNGIRLGHNRLSIIDTSEKGNQPMKRGRNVIIFNGEIYNFKELKEKYKIKTESNSDTEIALKLYQLKGKDFVKELDGEFAIIILDLVKNKIFFARDPLGIKPIYYYKWGEELIISSEIKSIISFIKAELDEDSFKEFLLFGYSGFKTIFKGIAKAYPGLLYEYNIKKKLLNSDVYYSLKLETQEEKSYEYYRDTLREKIISAVKKRMISDVPISATLSGGIDSSIIVGIMAKYSKHPVKTYSISLGNQQEDLEAARIVSKHFKTDHQEIIIPFEKVYEDLDKIIKFAEEPMDKGSLVPTYYLAHSVKEKVTLIGEGADECFAGYKRHQLENLGKVEDFVKYFDEYIRLFPNKHDEIFSEFDKNNWNSILLYDLKTEIPEFHNMRIDKMFMSNSVEARVPYLDPDVVEFALKIPYKYKQNPEKRILREAFQDILPEEIFNRKKSALKIPYAEWVERDKIKDIVFKSDIMSRETIESLYAQPNIRNRSRIIWYLYLISQWKNIWL